MDTLILPHFRLGKNDNYFGSVSATPVAFVSCKCLALFSKKHAAIMSRYQGLSGAICDYSLPEYKDTGSTHSLVIPALKLRCSKASSNFHKLARVYSLRYFLPNTPILSTQLCTCSVRVLLCALFHVISERNLI